MKKCILVLISLSVVFTLCACGGGKDKNGTYYPDFEEMKANLNESGYTVSDSSPNLPGDSSSVSYTGSYLSATKGEEYIVFYWLDEADAVDYFANRVEESGVSCNKFITLKNDEKFGSLICCGTEKAIEDAGIRIVDVKVNVN